MLFLLCIYCFYDCRIRCVCVLKIAFSFLEFSLGEFHKKVHRWHFRFFPRRTGERNREAAWSPYRFYLRLSVWSISPSHSNKTWQFPSTLLLYKRLMFCDGRERSVLTAWNWHFSSREYSFLCLHVRATCLVDESKVRVICQVYMIFLFIAAVSIFGTLIFPAQWCGRYAYGFKQRAG